MPVITRAARRLPSLPAKAQPSVPAAELRSPQCVPSSAALPVPVVKEARPRPNTEQSLPARGARLRACTGVVDALRRLAAGLGELSAYKTVLRKRARTDAPSPAGRIQRAGGSVQFRLRRVPGVPGQCDAEDVQHEHSAYEQRHHANDQEGKSSLFLNERLRSPCYHDVTPQSSVQRAINSSLMELRPSVHRSQLCQAPPRRASPQGVDVGADAAAAEVGDKQLLHVAAQDEIEEGRAFFRVARSFMSAQPSGTALVPSAG